MIKVQDIGTCSYRQIRLNFHGIAQTAEFSAAATCGVEQLSEEGKTKLLEGLRKAGLELQEYQMDYAIETIAGRLVARI